MSNLIKSIKASLEAKTAITLDMKVTVNGETRDIIAVGTIDTAFGISDQYDVKSIIVNVFYCEIDNGELKLANRVIKNNMNEIEIKKLLEEKIINNPALVAA